MLFISDLHLQAKDTLTHQRFAAFINGPAQTAQALFLLGDVFDVWIGDEQLALDPYAAQVAALLRALPCPKYLLRGNRDFLLGEGFSRASGCALLPEQTVLTVGGMRLLLLHGDELCTDDLQYQQVRKNMTRNWQWQRQVLAMPVTERLKLAAQFKMDSAVNKATLQAEIMDVNAGAVSQIIERHTVQTLIHGHTHRPAKHEVDGHTRHVLTDWQHPDWAANGYLRVNSSGEISQHPF
jgi:UDP-2,3-diacylglucosamine hydrolase